MSMLTQPIKYIEVAGMLDSNWITQMRTKLAELAIKKGDTILIDLAQVQFMDSSGLSALIICLQHTRRIGAKLYLCGPTDQVKMVLELTSMNKLFPIFANRQSFELSMAPSASTVAGSYY